jgi:hypothetical protein
MGQLPMQTVEMSAPRKLVRRLGGSNLPFGGTWTFEITPVAEGSTLRITIRDGLHGRDGKISAIAREKVWGTRADRRVAGRSV